MNVVNNIIDTIKLLDKIEEEYKENPQKLSEVEIKIIDVLHYIENNHLNTSQRYRVVSLLSALRLERRKIKNNGEILKVFERHKSKLLITENRKLLLEEIKKTEKQLPVKYNPRKYTKEELKELVGD